MRSLNEYCIECKGKKKEGIYKVCALLAPICLIIALAGIFPAVIVNLWFLLGVGALLIIALVADIVAKRNVYTIAYLWRDDCFWIKKIDLDGKESILEEIKCDQRVAVAIVEDFSDGIDYTDKNDNNRKITVKLKYDGRKVYVSLDKYMYSLICLGGRNDILR